jgi:hypothetical protein
VSGWFFNRSHSNSCRLASNCAHRHSATGAAQSVEGRIGFGLDGHPAARWTRHSWRYAAALGALLSTQGLVELVMLNIAYNVGAFSPTLPFMMVVMTLLTTMSTAPILNLLGIENHCSIKHSRQIAPRCKKHELA